MEINNDMYADKLELDVDELREAVGSLLEVGEEVERYLEEIDPEEDSQCGLMLAQLRKRIDKAKGVLNDG